MKEFSIEEKARAYDEALERAKVYWETDNDNTLDIKAKGTMEYLFPELAESEDEKIRKEILEVAKTVVSRDGTLYGKKYNCREWITWLEKQGKQKEYTFKSIPRLLDMIEPSDKAKAYCQKLIDTLVEEGYNTDAKIVKEVLKEWNGEDVPMAVMDEQKPVDKPVPKFKVGDWCIDNEDGTIFQIMKVLDNTYTYKTNEDKEYSCSHYSLENDAHLWTIQDAKDGDVLVADSRPFIYNGSKNEVTVGAYCGFNVEHKFSFAHNYVINRNITPATKEQRDTLFAKMKEFGYEWDFEKKELMKIEDEEYNGEDYGIDSLFHAQRILEKTLGSVDGYETDDGILSHKCAITAVKKLYEQKSAAWSKEDERMFDYALDMIEWYSGKNGDKSKLVSDWLKSIKDRVQPKQEWSKEDKERFISCLKRLGSGNPEQPETINSKWFKEHVFPQNSWKPSSLDIKILEDIRDGKVKPVDYALTLHCLIDRLKEIKGE